MASVLALLVVCALGPSAASAPGERVLRVGLVLETGGPGDPTAMAVTLGATVLSAVPLALPASPARSSGAADGLIAFARPDGLYVMQADGSGVRAVWRGGVVNDLAWSPDGAKLAFGAKGAIMIVDADGSGLVRAAARAARSLAWSPDGRRIAFTTARWAKPPDIWVVNVDGSRARRLTRTPNVWETNVDWSPDGRRLVFDTGSWSPRVFVMKTDGSDRHNLTPTHEFAWSEEADWSPDGRRLVFTYAKPFGADFGIGEGNCEIWVMNADGAAQVRLTRNRLYDGSPAWSPDGKRIAFVREAPGNLPGEGEIFVMNADGTGVTRLTHNLVREASPAWQPTTH